MGDVCYILNPDNIETGTLQRADSCLTSAARAFNIYLYLPQAVYHSFPGGITGRHLSRVRRTFAGTFKSGCSRASPGQGISLGVGKGYYRIVEGRLDVSPSGGNGFALSPSRFGSPLLWHPALLVKSLNYFLVIFSHPAAQCHLRFIP
jgi:hypothetical protein